MIQHSTALITGASERIGHESVRITAAGGWNMALVARRGELLSQLASMLIRKDGVEAAAIMAELSDPDSLNQTR